MYCEVQVNKKIESGTGMKLVMDEEIVIKIKNKKIKSVHNVGKIKHLILCCKDCAFWNEIVY
jgi:hypothetical protein